MIPLDYITEWRVQVEQDLILSRAMVQMSQELKPEWALEVKWSDRIVSHLEFVPAGEYCYTVGINVVQNKSWEYLENLR